MCLDTVTSQYSRRNPLKKTVKGWKVFEIVRLDNLSPNFLPRQLGLYFENYHYDNGKPIKTNKWLKSTTKYGYERYPVGFHIYLSKRSAQRHKAGDTSQKYLPVIGRGVVAKGEQRGRRVVVCKELFIIEKKSVTRLKSKPRSSRSKVR
jgi:hypothetical protein